MLHFLFAALLQILTLVHGSHAQKSGACSKPLQPIVLPPPLASCLYLGQTCVHDGTVVLQEPFYRPDRDKLDLPRFVVDDLSRSWRDVRRRMDDALPPRRDLWFDGLQMQTPWIRRPTPLEDCADLRAPFFDNCTTPLFLFPYSPFSFWRFFSSTFAGLWAAQGAAWSSTALNVAWVIGRTSGTLPHRVFNTTGRPGPGSAAAAAVEAMTAAGRQLRGRRVNGPDGTHEVFEGAVGEVGHVHDDDGGIGGIGGRDARGVGAGVLGTVGSNAGPRGRRQQQRQQRRRLAGDGRAVGAAAGGVLGAVGSGRCYSRALLCKTLHPQQYYAPYLYEAARHVRRYYRTAIRTTQRRGTLPALRTLLQGLRDISTQLATPTAATTTTTSATSPPPPAIVIPGAGPLLSRAANVAGVQSGVAPWWGSVGHGDARVLRVVFATPKHAGDAFIGNWAELVGWCRGWGPGGPGGVSGWRAVCVEHVFGAGNLTDDLALLEHTDLLVAEFEPGAAAARALPLRSPPCSWAFFMSRWASVLELLPYGTNRLQAASGCRLAMERERNHFHWAIEVLDQALVTRTNVTAARVHHHGANVTRIVNASYVKHAALTQTLARVVSVGRDPLRYRRARDNWETVRSEQDGGHQIDMEQLMEDHEGWRQWDAQASAELLQQAGGSGGTPTSGQGGTGDKAYELLGGMRWAPGRGGSGLGVLVRAGVGVVSGAAAADGGGGAEGGAWGTGQQEEGAEEGEWAMSAAGAWRARWGRGSR